LEITEKAIFKLSLDVTKQEIEVSWRGHGHRAGTCIKGSYRVMNPYIWRGWGAAWVLESLRTVCKKRRCTHAFFLIIHILVNSKMVFNT
jgi:hypothetical protein